MIRQQQSEKNFSENYFDHYGSQIRYIEGKFAA